MPLDNPGLSGAYSGPGPFADPTGGDISGIDADALLSQIESGEGPSQPQEQSPLPVAAQTPAPSPTPQEVEFNWNGKSIKATPDKMKQWAQQGYDYAQKMADFNKKSQEFETSQKGFQDKYSLYESIDKYAQENPDWWGHVQDNFQRNQSQTQGQSGLDPSHPIAGKINSIEQALQPVLKYIQDAQTEKQESIRLKEDTELAEQIKSIREQYSNLDLTAPDGQTGKSLEMQVLEYAANNGIKNFKTAFRDFNHDKLIKLAEERGRESVAKESIKNKKIGLLGQTQAPTKGLTPLNDVSNKSWNDIEAEIREELGF